MKMILSLLFVGALTSTLTYGQQFESTGASAVDDAVKRFVASCHEQLQNEIVEAKQRRSNDRVKDLEKQGIFHAYIGSLPRNRPLKVGDIGRLVARRATILQVLGPSDVLVKTEWYDVTPRPSGSSEMYEETVWITGLATKEMVDRRLYKTDQVFDVIETKTYKTTTGTNTVLVLTPVAIDTARIEAASKEFLAKAKEEKKARQQAVEAEKEGQRTARQRTWTSGKHTVRAEFISFIGGKVQLKRLDDGQKIEVRMELLSDEDQAFIRERKWEKGAEGN
jgi:hypothetical protein